MVVKQDSYGSSVPPTDLDKFECELQDMLNIVEKHVASKEDDEKVCELNVNQFCTCPH